MQPWIKILIIASLVTVLIIGGTIVYLQYFYKRILKISTTTSLDETGLLHEIEIAYETRYPIDVQFIPVGTGIAIQQAQRGDVDAILVHSPKNEKQFLEQGYGVCRKIIAYNFFTIVGPESDPAQIGGSNATEALKKIVNYGQNHTNAWISRADNSGTHSKEQSLWTSAGYNYNEICTQSSWYVNRSSGMGETLLMANQFSAYTLSDTGTYLKYSKDARISLVALVSEGKELLNVYSVMAVNQTIHTHVNFDDAITFIKFLISDECQQLIENYGKNAYGKSLFIPTVQLLKQQNSTEQIFQWIKSYAFFTSPLDSNGSECPPEYRDGHPELYD